MSRAWGVWTAVLGVVALTAAACGGGEATPTAAPAPTRAGATATPAPAPTPTSAAPSPTRAAPTATAAPAGPTPTPAPAGIPTPVINLQGKRGGTLQLIALANQPYGYDTYDVRESFAYEVWNPVYNNLIWPDPYAGGQTLVGDVAEGWKISEDGTVLTFSLRKGITFHDGAPLTAKDVAYNIDRAAVNPRSATMTFFKPRLRAIAKVEALDDYTVKVTMSTPSNSALRVLAMNQMLMYPAHFPFPDRQDEFKKNPIGSGPFKVKSVDRNVRIELLRNDSYWKRGLPYVDGIVYSMMSAELVPATFRTGKADATQFNNNEILPSVAKLLEKETGFVFHLITISVNQVVLNQRAPWTDKRVREALSLAIDRQAIVEFWQEGAGSPYTAPLLAPELGGQWGISTEVMKSRPGFRPDKTADIARAKQLLTEAGAADVTMNILTSTSFQRYGEVVEANLRALGVKTKLELSQTGPINERLLRGDFDVYLISGSISIDDPSDYLNSWVVTGASSNFGKWSMPDLDRLLTEQDKVLDVAKRKEMLIQAQEMILRENFGAFIPTLVRLSPAGYQPWVKNYPPNLFFLHSPQYRWEQVWLDRTKA